MAKINLDIGHALSREDQRQNRRNPCFISQSSSSYYFSGNGAAKFPKKIIEEQIARDDAMCLAPKGAALTSSLGQRPRIRDSDAAKH
jgi:hypothetical protein